MNKALCISDTATSFYLPFDQAFSIRVESHSNKLHMVHIWLLATGSHFRYEQKTSASGEFGSDVLYTTKKASEDLDGFPVNIRIESRDAETDDEWRGSTIQVNKESLGNELEIWALSADYGSDVRKWDDCKVSIKSIT